MSGSRDIDRTEDNNLHRDSVINVNCGDSVDRIPAKNSLIWINTRLDGQEIPAMVDSGANPNCLSLRCVQGSDFLKQLTRQCIQVKGNG